MSVNSPYSTSFADRSSWLARPQSPAPFALPGLQPRSSPVGDAVRGWTANTPWTDVAASLDARAKEQAAENARAAAAAAAQAKAAAAAAEVAAAAAAAAAAAETTRRAAQAQALQREAAASADPGDDTPTAQDVDVAWNAVGQAVANELRLAMARGVGLEPTAASADAAARGDPRYEAEVDRARTQVRDETPAARKTSLAASEFDAAAGVLETAEAESTALRTLPSGVRRGDQTEVHGADQAAQRRFDAAWQALDTAVSAELEAAEGKLHGVDVPGFDARASAVSAIKTTHAGEGERLDDLIDVASARRSIADELAQIDPDDPRLSAQQARLARDDPVTFAATKVLMRLPDDPALDNALMEATTQTRAERTRRDVARLMGADPPEFAAAEKVLGTNMDAARSSEERARILSDAGSPFFSAVALRDRFERLTAAPMRDTDMATRYDTAMRGDKIGQLLSTVRTPEVADVALRVAYDTIDPTWGRSNDSARAIGLTQGVELFKGISHCIEVSGDPTWAARFAEKLTAGAGTHDDLLRQLMHGPTLQTPESIPLDTVRTAITTTAEDGAGAQLALAMRRQFEKESRYDLMPRLAPSFDSVSKAAQLGADFAQFQRDPKAAAEPVFDGFAKALGTDAQTMQATQLRNFVGASLGMKPSNEAAANALDNSQEWYAGKAAEVIDPIAKRIRAVGGDNPKVSMVPVVHASKLSGVAPTALFKVEDAEGRTKLVDDRGGKTFEDLGDWLRHNDFAEDGIVVAPKDLAMKPDAQGRVELVTSAAHDTTTGQQLVKGAAVVGVAAAVVTTVAFTGGAAAIGWTAVGVGSAAALGSSAYELNARLGHDQGLATRDAIPMWVGFVAGAAGGVGTVGRVAQGVAQGSKAAIALGSAPVAGSVAVAGLGAAVVSGVITVQDWDEIGAGAKFMFVATTIAPFAVGARGARVAAGWSDYAGNRPTRIGAPDSGNGGVLAALTTQKVLNKLGAPYANTVPMVLADQLHAPYGGLLPADLARATRGGIWQAALRGCDVVAGACNTASGSVRLNPRIIDGLPVPFANLVNNTARRMAESPAMVIAYIATEGMVKTGLYEKLVTALSPGKEVQALVAKDWASLVDKGALNSTDPAVQAKVQASVDAVVDKIALGTQQVFLNCTHYPAMRKAIETSLQRLPDSRRDIEVIDPASVQAAAVVDALPLGTQYQGRPLKTVVLVSGPKENLNNTREALKGLLGDKAFKNIRLVGVKDFSEIPTLRSFIQSGGSPLQYLQMRRMGRDFALAG